MHIVRTLTSALSKNAYHQCLPMTYKHNISQTDTQTNKHTYIHSSQIVCGFTTIIQVMWLSQGWKKSFDFFKNSKKSDFLFKSDFFLFKSDFFGFFEIRIFVPRFYQIFETGLSAQSHKLHGRYASAISGYTLPEQKVSKQQLIKVSLPWLYMYVMLFSVI